jgi:hypothetical protein
MRKLLYKRKIEPKQFGQGLGRIQPRALIFTTSPCRSLHRLISCSLTWLDLVPGGGIEPPRAEARRILSPLRLPVPPSRLETFRPFYTKEIGPILHSSIRPASVGDPPTVAALVAVTRMRAAPCSILSAASRRSSVATMLYLLKTSSVGLRPAQLLLGSRFFLDEATYSKFSLGQESQ